MATVLEAKQIVPPGRPSDLVDYLIARRDEPCGRSIPELIMKAICWMEKVAEFSVEQRATQGRLAWAIKDRIVESLSTGAPLTKRAPSLPRCPASEVRRAGRRRYVRRGLADLGLDKASQGLGFAEMVRRSGYHSAGAMPDRGSPNNDTEKDEDLGAQSAS